MKILENLSDRDCILKMYGKLSNHLDPRTVVEALLMAQEDFQAHMPEKLIEFLSELYEEFAFSATSETHKILEKVVQKYL